MFVTAADLQARLKLARPPQLLRAVAFETRHDEQIDIAADPFRFLGMGAEAPRPRREHVVRGAPGDR